MKDLSIEYDRDFCYWLEQNVALLRAGKLTEIDVENIRHVAIGKTRFVREQEKIPESSTNTKNMVI